jgi:hypothetical protein
LLTKTLIELAVSAVQLSRRDDAETCVARAVWSGTISGLNMDQELAARGFAVAPPQPGAGPVRHNVSGRPELERSLIDQFREIALGLLADRLVREADLSTICWWQQYSTLRCTPPPCMEDPDDPDFQAFQDEIFHLIAVRRLRPISQSELMTRTVKINGAAIPFWQEGTINRHLAEIGSSLRLFVAGRDVVWAAKLLEMLGEPVVEPLCPSHFIFGEIRPITAIGKANLFDFVREYAVSPYVNTTSPGLHDQGRVVLRDLLLGRAVEFLALPGNEATDAAGKLMDQRCRALGITRLEVMSDGILGHELGHVHLLFPPGQAAGFQSWHAIVRDDICRFAQMPRSAEEIRSAFRRTFEGLGGIYEYFLTGFPPNESPVHQPLAQTIVALVNDGLLRREADKRFCFTGFVGA